MFDVLARFAYRRARALAVLAGAFVVIGGAFGGGAFDVLKPFGFEDPASEAVQSREALGQAAGVEPDPQLIALVEGDRPVDSPAGRQRLADVEQTLAADPDVGRTVSPFDRDGGPEMVSTDGRSAYVLGFFKEGLDDTEKNDAAQRLEEALEGEATLGGFGAAANQIGETVESDLRRAEIVALPILFLLSFLIFRSAIAAALPVMIGVLSIVGALVGLRLGAEVLDLSIFAVNLVTGMGLGLSIDYSLFMVSRYREELAKRDALFGPAKRVARWEALRETMQTAGRTVVFSSLTVATAMAALLVFPQRFLYSMGVGGALVALFAGLVAITILPAVLALLGTRVNAGAPKFLQAANQSSAKPATAGFWYRLAQFVMRRPIGVATAAAAVMIVAGLPFLRSEYVFADAGILPTTQSARQVDDALEGGFDQARTTPIVVEVQTQAPGAVKEIGAEIEEIDRVASVAPPVPIGDGLTRIDVVSTDTQYADSSQEVVRQIRTLDAPAGLRVGGSSAEFIDQRQSLDEHLPTAIAIIAVTTLILLFLMTGSVVLPIKSLIMNLLTVSVAFGVLVLVFQDGRFESLLDYRSPGALDNSNAILLFAVIFGLSTDYGVFLLTRIKEARDAGASDTEAVAIGLERTGRIVSAAALLFCVALGAFVTSSIIFIKQFAVGTVVGVAVDATIVRALLVPSLMVLLGRWNWWAPGPLRRLHERIGLGHGESSSVAQRAPAG